METLQNLPTPLEILLDPISLVVLGMYASLMIWEALFPARELPKVKNWKTRGLLTFGVFFYLSSYLPLIWDGYISKYQLFDLSFLGDLGGAVVGVVIYEFGLFLWHYSLHKSDFLWKVFHQMHHSAERIDTYGAFYFSPMDMAGFTLLGSLCLVGITGFTPGASTIILLTTVFLGIFQHSNIVTPQWLGYLIQRPESHTVHHAKGIHAYNYSDLPIFDIIFGTFNNPKGYSHETGFYDGASKRIKEMLFFKDISKENQSKQKMKNSIVGIALVVMSLVSCTSDDISGSGVLTTENRELNAFIAISVDGIANVNIVQGNAQSVKITADDNIIGLVKTEIKDGVLEIYLTSGHNYKNIDVSVEIMAKGLNGVANKGSGTLKVANVESPEFYLDNLGSGDISLSGTSNTLRIENEGSGRISGFSFLADKCSIAIMGSGDVEISCTDELDVKIDGSAKVFYKGNPHVTKNILGSGNVIDEN